MTLAVEGDSSPGIDRWLAAGGGGLRIVGGAARGRKLRVPRGLRVRPTADRVRETIFNILGQRFDGERVLDLYAGSGAFGLEALSRGAGEAVLVDADREAIAACRENASALGYDARVEIVRSDALAALERFAAAGRRFDLVFLDPPYAAGPKEALVHLDRLHLLAPGGCVVAEHDRRLELEARIGALAQKDRRRIGESAVSFFAATNEEFP